MKNLVDSDGTLIVFFTTLSGGTLETFEWCDKRNIPLFAVDASRFSVDQAAQEAMTFLSTTMIKTLNVAGPRASKQAKAYDYAFHLFSCLISRT